MREPLEAGVITISRAAQQAQFPANFQLIAAMNPCPCGYANTLNKACRCSPEQIKRYQHRLSGPFLDRIDLHVCLKPLPQHLVIQNHQTLKADDESTAWLKKKVCDSRERQWHRQKKCNNALGPQELKRYCHLDSASQSLLEQALTKWHLSARAVHRSLRVARTIADLTASTTIESNHLSEALSYRSLL